MDNNDNPRSPPANNNNNVLMPIPIIDPNKVSNDAIQKYKAEFQKIKDVTFTMPFNLMNFKFLNEIVLGEVKKSSRNNDPSDENDNIGERQTFGVQGCKFGRDGSNNYSYPD